ncbi:hypothetical protein C8J45_103340 [Sphingomonas sp. PP-CE-3G-477]|uniref:hypothetical protein n=1 Tax=Sphingomonas sp. PP-CE-3G-477 TaxID=2135660 RepID=UPI000D39B3EC|nr:hypothetical protein [Sphingomonas sp. PP-CE-3G-477]PTQ64490.1 hypothetical protein C8J45_103340 [Sphingomonas sp. PP-CE-3G-477]
MPTDEAEVIRALEVRVSDMEWQLRAYHEQLENALEHNNNLQLNATWGIVRGTSMLAFIIALWSLNKLWITYVTPESTWIVNILIFVAAGFIWYHYAGYVERGHKADEKKLWPWPKWDAPADL